MAEAKNCPRCGLVNPPSAQRCDCGYDFAVRRVAGSYLPERDRARTEVPAGAGLMIGCLLVLFGAIIGVAVAVPLQLRAYDQTVEAIRAKEPDRPVDGLLVIPFLAEGVVVGVALGALGGGATAVVVLLIRDRRRARVGWVKRSADPPAGGEPGTS